MSEMWGPRAHPERCDIEHACDKPTLYRAKRHDKWCDCRQCRDIRQTDRDLWKALIVGAILLYLFVRWS